MDFGLQESWFIDKISMNTLKSHPIKNRKFIYEFTSSPDTPLLTEKNRYKNLENYTLPQEDNFFRLVVIPALHSKHRKMLGSFGWLWKYQSVQNRHWLAMWEDDVSLPCEMFNKKIRKENLKASTKATSAPDFCLICGILVLSFNWILAASKMFHFGDKVRQIIILIFSPLIPLQSPNFVVLNG